MQPEHNDSNKRQSAEAGAHRAWVAWRFMQTTVVLGSGRESWMPMTATVRLAEDISPTSAVAEDRHGRAAKQAQHAQSDDDHSQTKVMMRR